MENVLDKEKMTLDEVDTKIDEFENALKKGKITWHSIEEMNDVVDKVILK